MSIATMTSKGQITVPLAVRKLLGLRPGAKIDFVQTDEGFKLVPLRGEVTAIKGRFAGRVAQAVTLAQMDEAIGAAAAARSERERRERSSP